MKKHVTKILRQIASEKGGDSAHVKQLYKKLKKGWKQNAGKINEKETIHRNRD